MTRLAECGGGERYELEAQGSLDGYSWSSGYVYVGGVPGETIDLAVAHSGGAGVWILQNDGLGQFSTASSVAAPASPGGLAAAPVTPDAYPDLLVSDSASNAVEILCNNDCP